jgi:hypothetical protein
MRRLVAAGVALTAIVVILVLANGSSSRRPVTVPDVVGKSYAEGVEAIKDAGFRVASVDPARCSELRSIPSEAVVVARIRRGGTFVQGGVDAVPSGTKLSLDAGVAQAGTTACLADTPKKIDWGPIVGVSWVIGAVLASVYAGRDMRRRGENGGVWGLIVFLLFPLGVLLWFVVRENKPVIPGTGVQMRRDAEAHSPFESSDRG